MPGLKVNFYKTKLYGVILNFDFLLLAFVFLNCCIDCLSFKLLGVLVGASPKITISWKRSSIILGGGCIRGKVGVYRWVVRYS